MAKATTYRYGSLVATIGDGATPTEVFTAPCGLSQKSLKFNKDIGADVIPDCADPDAPGYEEQTVKSRSWSYSGSGILTKEALATWRDLYESNESSNCRITVPGNLAAGGGKWEGKIMLQSFEITASQGERWQVSLEFVGDGPVTWTDAAA